MSKRAVIAIDIQNDYFPSGKFTLAGIENAASAAGKVLAAAREKGDLVIHVRHEFADPAAPFFNPGTQGAEIHPSARPIEGETVITKNFVNAFRNTDLKSVLDRNGIESVVIVGAMSHMCIDAATRAAADLGYKTTVINDACATRDLEFGGVVTPAAQVQAAMMASFAFGYAEVVDAATWVSRP